MTRLSWFSPLPRDGAPPDGAARYTRAVLPSLAARFELQLFTFQESWDREVEEHAAAVVRCDMALMPWHAVNGAEISLHVLSDDPASQAAWSVSRIHRGIVVLCDDNLATLVSSLPPEDLEELEPWMLSRRGSRAMEDLQALRAGGEALATLARAYDFGELAARHALGVLVHDEARQAKLQRAVTCPVALAPRPDEAGPGGGDHATAVAGLVERAIRYRPAALLHEVARRITGELGMWGPPQEGYLPEAIRPQVDAIARESDAVLSRLCERIAATSAAMRNSRP